MASEDISLNDSPQPIVQAVASEAAHVFSKGVVEQIRLIAGLGVEGDAHCGITVQHRSRVARDPGQPNLRQIHLIHAELLEELDTQGFSVSHGQIGENITTRHLDLLALPVGTELHLGPSAIVRLTGLRNPCHQLNRFQEGLMAAVLDRSSDGALVRKAGVMGVVTASGVVRAGDLITVRLPVAPHRSLEPV
ncbi:MOSC domain-containing protein [Hydrogenophaga sp.]|uniref:MOSC domain-containing protein n=1 Tax=Hydrogenophaga sp. TaxID=1904254 RepID=UPI0027226329|nr:MOSC domain-containing protein [Hydrogenophaga sp.]MDO8904925.1 MOSC domain-containing protein [Hydrogenophaga sp.]